MHVHVCNTEGAAQSCLSCSHSRPVTSATRTSKAVTPQTGCTAALARHPQDDTLWSTMQLFIGQAQSLDSPNCFESAHQPSTARRTACQKQSSRRQQPSVHSSQWSQGHLRKDNIIIHFVIQASTQLCTAEQLHKHATICACDHRCVPHVAASIIILAAVAHAMRAHTSQ